MLINRIPFNAVQKGIYQLVSQGQSVPVYDSLPTGTETMPYIWLGEFHGTPVDRNKTHTMHAISQQLDVWSAQQGKKEINGIMDDIAYLVSRYELGLDGYRQVGAANIPLYQAVCETYADQTSAYHGIVMLEYLIEQID